MIETVITLGTLAFVLIYNTIFWSRHSQKLVDKLMSRNFSEYQHSQTLTQSKPSIKIDNELPEDLRQLNDMVAL